MVVVLPASMCAMMPILRIDRKSCSDGSLPMMMSFLIRSAARRLVSPNCAGCRSRW